MRRTNKNRVKTFVVSYNLLYTRPSIIFSSSLDSSDSHNDFLDASIACIGRCITCRHSISIHASGARRTTTDGRHDAPTDIAPPSFPCASHPPQPSIFSKSLRGYNTDLSHFHGCPSSREGNSRLKPILPRCSTQHPDGFYHGILSVPLQQTSKNRPTDAFSPYLHDSPTIVL